MVQYMDSWPQGIIVLPQIMAQAFISFQQLVTPATKQDRRLYETGVY